MSLKKTKKNINDHSTVGVAMATIFTILPLAGVYILPNVWWGILLKVIFVIIILEVLKNYWFHPTFVNANRHGFGAGVILNMLLFSGIYFFYPHWIIYIFEFIFIFSLSTLKRILQKHYYAS